jgi:hypothetical protein
MTKLQDQPATMTTTNTTILGKYIALIPTGVGLRKTGKRISGHTHQKGVKGPSTIGQASITNTTGNIKMFVNYN